MPTLSLPAGRIAYSDTGAGPAVILVHSSGNTRAQWKKLETQLAASHRVLALDLFDYGESDPWSGARPMSVADQAQPVIALATEVAAAPVHLVGHSNGGGIALHAALSLRSRLASLTLIEPIVPCLLREAGEREALAEFTGVKNSFLRALGRGDNAAAAAGFLGYWIRSGTWESTPAERQPAIAATMPKIGEEFRAVFADTLDAATIRRLDVHTLLLRGT